MITRKIDGDNVLWLEDDKQILGLYPEFDENDENVMVKLVGDISRALSVMFQDEIASFLNASLNVCLELSGVSHFSYSAMLYLLDLQRNAENEKLTFCLKGMTPAIKEKFDMTGLSQMLDIA